MKRRVAAMKVKPTISKLVSKAIRLHAPALVQNIIQNNALLERLRRVK